MIGWCPGFRAWTDGRGKVDAAGSGRDARDPQERVSLGLGPKDDDAQLGRTEMDEDSAFLRELVESLDETDPAKYDDLGLRSQLASTPSHVSPDIIPYGQATVPDPSTFFASNWESDVGVGLSAGAPNNIYLRAMNYGREPVEGKGYLHACEATLIAWPSLWRERVLWTGDREDYVVLRAAPGRVTAGAKPLVFTPPSFNPPVAYCLVGRVSTPAHPNPVPEDGSLLETARYFEEAAASSVIRAAAMIGTGLGGAFVYTLGLETRAEAVPHLRLVLQGNHVPLGSKLVLAADAPGLNPPVEVRVASYPRFVAGAATKVKAGSSVPVTIRFEAAGSSPPPGAWITLQAFVPVESPGPPRVVRVGGYAFVFR
jgi:hypothetical protein